MLEHRRQHYLSLLGIDNYVPTRLLANSAPSVLLPDELLIDPALLSRISTQPQFLEPSNDDSVQSEANATEASAVVGSSAETSANTSVHNSVTDITTTASRALLEQELLAKATQQPLQKEGVDSVTKTAEDLKKIDVDGVTDQPANANTQGVVKFVFSVWRVKDILILDIRKVREALPTDYLLQNILRSVGYGMAQLPASESLRWPLFNNKKFNNKKLMIRS